ncbi:hypothetical protein GCM10011339_44250 [Echinicola rosea]|uniref:Uncharacterized protein n=1 Tax=Echinicola rosea TaxID=1807691 RepID=A0ABQ1VDA0_9BACT|nr:hypothetical protein GCM10011339_44250 [Echinicola rosea]
MVTMKKCILKFSLTQSIIRTPRTARTPRTVRILRGGNDVQKHANEFNSKIKVRFLKFVYLKAGRFTAFYIKKKKYHSKI